MADSTLNQILAVAYRNQIRNGDTRLFAQTGKPKTRGVLTGPQRRGAAGESGEISERLSQKLNRTRLPSLHQFQRFAKRLARVPQPF
jgi:hypothetical protein